MKITKMLAVTVCFWMMILILPQTGMGAEKPLTIAFKGDAVTLDPPMRAEITTFSIQGAIFDRLIRADENLKIIPDLATSWKMLDDYTWEFKLRKGVKFHNGEDFTSRSAKFSLERAKTHPKSQMQPSVPGYKEIVAVDDYTLRFVTQKPEPDTLMMLARIYMTPEKYYSEKGEAYLATHPVGTGAYKFVKWVKDDRMELVANESWYRAPVGFKEVVFRPIPEDTTRVAALISGEIDVCYGVSTPDIPRVERDKNTYISRIPSLRAMYVMFDVHSEKGGKAPDGQPGLPTGKPNPFRDIRVRKAIAHAIKVDDIIQYVMEGNATPCTQILGINVFGYNPNIKRPKYDLNRAKALMKEAGYEKGFVTNLDAPTDRYPNAVQVAEAIAGQVSQIGIKVNLKTTPKAVFFPKLNRYESPFFFSGYSNPSWAITMKGLFMKKTKSTGRLNRGRFYDPSLEKKIEEAITTMDETKREKLYQEASADAMATYFMIPLYYPDLVNGYSKRVKGRVRADEYLYVYDITPAK